ncbi:Tn3 family transposase [Streptomyces sp. NPDC059985]|uniref:Tn3 family transposase n=1 Tax=Streptomyces sp. NPDC059985 TaxID=3347025 RepID=UPI0036BA61F1
MAFALWRSRGAHPLACAAEAPGYSQLINCTASVVAAMIEGAMRHGSLMDVEANHTDSHGHSKVGFGVRRLPHFGLLVLVWRISKVKLYRSGGRPPGCVPSARPVATRPIRWERLIGLR